MKFAKFWCCEYIFLRNFWRQSSTTDNAKTTLNPLLSKYILWCFLLLSWGGRGTGERERKAFLSFLPLPPPLTYVPFQFLKRTPLHVPNFCPYSQSFLILPNSHTEVWYEPHQLSNMAAYSHCPIIQYSWKFESKQTPNGFKYSQP